MATRKQAHFNAVAEHLRVAGDQAAGMSGITKIFHELDVAFVNALAGAEKEAHEALAAAEAEYAKFQPTLKHLEREISLLIAKVHAAALWRRRGGKTARKGM